MKPTVVFFSRSYQSILFPLLKSEEFFSVHVTFTKQEKSHIENQGFKVEYCFEEFDNVDRSLSIDGYLETSFVSDRFLNRLTFEERQFILKKEISFWSEIFNKYKPVAVVNEQVALEISEVMYIEAKKRQIIYKAWMNNPINGYFYWLSTPMTLIPDSKFLETIPSQDSIEIAKSYILDIKQKNERPYYLNPFMKTKLRNLLGSVKSYTIYKINTCFRQKSTLHYENYSDEKWQTVTRNISSYFYKYNSINEIVNHEIILYPLHYEPEASLSYLSEFFSNQIGLIENLAKCLKNNQIIVVKEHPAQAGMLLTKKYRELKKNISALYYLPHTIISYDIIKLSKLIITLTSHLGWEAIILGKPVYVIGNMFYKSYPFVNRFESFEVLRNQIRKDAFIYPEETATINFIARLFENSYKGFPFPGDDLYSKENIENIVSSLEEEIKSLLPD